MKDNTFTLSNGIKIPCIGFGTYKAYETVKDKDPVTEAIDAGYTLIDTASEYKNEKKVGTAIKNSDVNRKSLFITGKLWNTERGYRKTTNAFDRSLKELGLDYLDLYLIHWPANAKQFSNWKEINYDTWRAFEKLYKEGKIRSIGVSNFLDHHLMPLLDSCSIKPMVNQIEYRPGFIRHKTVEFCKKENILVEAWRPLGKGKILDNRVIKDIAEKYSVSPAQICIRWCIQNGILPIPKSSDPDRIRENINVFSFTLSDTDIDIINNLDIPNETRLDPDLVDF